MQITIGKDGLTQTWQANFPETTPCCYCTGEARIGFVAHEGTDKTDTGPFVCALHENKGKGDFWPHDCCAVAIYFCRDCLKPTALWNQA